jgi:Ca2+-transporting ATPase
LDAWSNLTLLQLPIVSLAVAAIPEGLPIVVTVTLALGVLRMAKRKAIVKKLPSVETLGSVSVICSDKTGTLTTNEMTTVRVFTIDDGVIDLQHTPPPTTPSEALVKTALVGNLCNRSFKNPEGVIVGPSTEVALYNVLATLGLPDRRAQFSKTSEQPFNSETKWQTVTGTLDSSVPFGTSSGSRELTFKSGAVETVLPDCGLYIRSDGSTGTFDSTLTQAVLTKASELSALGLRTVALAYGPDPASLIFCGLQGIMDPPRKGVADAISQLNSAQVQVVMITGDSEETALSIGRQLGLRINAAGKTSVLTGREIDTLSQRQLVDRVANVSIFARTTPRHKMAIIEAFQSRGAVVAMTGDGGKPRSTKRNKQSLILHNPIVNDAPALKMADIGISMGKGGTDVAKEAADVILVDDNFATIITAVEEGKSIFYNIQNFLGFQLSTAVAALTLITISTALRLPTPLNPMQILFINILMDGKVYFTIIKQLVIQLIFFSQGRLLNRLA